MNASLNKQKKAALIVVDVQNDFLPGGALAVKNGDRVVDPCNRLMEMFDTVVLTADWHPMDHVSFAQSHAQASAFETIQLPYGTQVLWPTHCVAGQKGADFAEKLNTLKASVIVRKGMHWDCDSYSGFMEADRQTSTGLAGWLKDRGIDEVWVCGLATDFCVSWTAQDAAQAGFDTFVVEDASAAIDLNGSLEAARREWALAGVKRATVIDALRRTKA